MCFFDDEFARCYYNIVVLLGWVNFLSFFVTRLPNRYNASTSFYKNYYLLCNKVFEVNKREAQVSISINYPSFSDLENIFFFSLFIREHVISRRAYRKSIHKKYALHLRNFNIILVIISRLEDAQ